MQSSIEYICAFGKNNEKRVIPLFPGLNVITGDSKTGKSAVVEIIDYCLFSSRSTIPKGVISNFSELFAITLQVESKFISIARPSYRSEEGNIAYIRVDVLKIDEKDISREFYENGTRLNLKEAQIEVEKHLGIAFLDSRQSFDQTKQSSGGKATLRSIVSFIFQHQNLIANKHSIFYRFDDAYRTKKTIEDFPVLMKWIRPEYLAYKRELDEKLAEHRRYERQLAREKTAESEIHSRLKNLIAPYMSLVGYSYEEEIDLESLKYLALNLPEVSTISSHQDTIESDLFEMTSLRHELRNQLSIIQSSISLYEDTTKQSETFESSLRFLNAISPIQRDGIENCICPICRSRVDSISSEINAIVNAKSELEDELIKIGNYSIDSTEHYESLRKERDNLKRQISALNQKIEILEKLSNEITTKKSLEKQAYLLKGQIETSARYYLGAANALASDSEISDLENRIEWLKKQLDGFDLVRVYAQAESQLSELMTSICNELDFEAELRPGKLVLDLKNFDFYYHFDGKEKITLSEMGSGANWLACHLSIFLGLMKLSAFNINSSIPSILVLDQPSQVYFPNTYGEIDSDGNVDDNIRQVKNIFRVLLSVIKDIESKAGYLPQIIVMEHANEEEFRPHIRRQWKRDGEKFI